MSQAVSVSHEGNVSTITFNAPPMNLMNIEILDALVEAHREADAHPDTRVMVTRSAIDRMFCNGLDPSYVLEHDSEGRLDIFRAIGRLAHGIYALTKPHITVVNGPAMAGGAVLALLSDYRYFAEEKGRISYSEVKVGIPVPSGIIDLLASIVHQPHLRDIVMLGKNMDARAAMQAGLADGIAPADKLEEAVAKQVNRLSRLSPDVLRTVKAHMRAPLLPTLANTLQGDAQSHEFTQFVEAPYLGEGLGALVEGRPPVFTK